jgi:hypothetical protein
MARLPQGVRTRGSQHWLQVLANCEQDVFERAVSGSALSSMSWLSPLQPDGYAEYRDQAFVDLLGIQLAHRSLRSFWPAGGPVWDGLGRSGSGAVLLVEAKANLPELASPRSRASPQSAERIVRSMSEAKPAFGAPATADWMGTYYQYANRLAHLCLLRACNQIDAYLVFLYFTGAAEVSGPSTSSAWAEPIRAAHQALQLGDGPLTPFVIETYVDVSQLTTP